MRRWMCSAIAALVCLVSWPHDAVDAGGKWFKHGHKGYGCAAPMMVGCHAPLTCGMPMGCAAPGCYAPGCAGCYAPNFHRPFAPLVAHYGMHYGAQAGYGWGCAAPFAGCAEPMGCGCAVPMLGGFDFDGAAMSYQPDLALDGMPMPGGIPDASNYYAPVGPMAAPIPSVPPADDVVW